MLHVDIVEPDFADVGTEGREWGVGGARALRYKICPSIKLLDFYVFILSYGFAI